MHVAPVIVARIERSKIRGDPWFRLLLNQGYWEAHAAGTSNKMHRDGTECAEVGVQGIAFLGMHDARERACQHEMAGFKRHTVRSELVGKPCNPQRWMAE